MIETAKPKTMKKIIYLSLVLPLILFSCESIPEAHFFSDVVEPEVGQEVFFTNDSHNATEFEWDFGDGYISSVENPSHVFTGTGTYDVVLTVYSNKGLSDKATITINVVIPTLLEIEVLEYNYEEPVSDISVWLFSSLSDWQTHEDNVEAEGITDGDGFVVFSHLGPYVYYVDVLSDFYDNYQIYEDLGVDWIRTDEIVPHKINRFTAWVDYYGTTKGTSSGQKSMIIRRIERKAADQEQPAATTEDWQTLYERSVKVK
jgi:PKD repeat protein